MLQPDLPRPIVLITGEPQCNPQVLRGDFDVRRLAAQRAVEHDTAAIVLDFGRDGRAAVRATRARSTAPLLAILTADAPAARRVEALEAGADDVLSIPYEDAELVARLRALIRRGRTHATDDDDDALQIDVARQRVRHRGHDIDVTPTELDILAALARRPGVVVSPARSKGSASGARPMTAAMLYTTISQLRQKLQNAGVSAAIRTVRGRGYALGDGILAQIRH